MSSRKEPASAQKIGAFGERVALDYLKNKGYELVAKNYQSGYGEIDLIVKNKEYLVFVEVKTRNHCAIDRPSAWVDRRKQKKIMKTAAVFLSENEELYEKFQLRFDIAEVIFDKTTRAVVSVEIIENAFTYSGDYSPL